MLRNLSPAHIMIVVVVLVVLFGWKRLPDMARSLGRSARVFKSEVEEMKKDGKGSSAASGSTVPGDVVNPMTGPTEQERLAAEARVAAEARRRPRGSPRGHAPSQAQYRGPDVPR